MIDKFLYHIPEYRQAKRFYAAQMEQVLSSGYIQVDETTHPVTDRPEQARKAYLWAVRSVLQPSVFFYYHKGSRSQGVVLRMLKDYQGVLQIDVYTAYSVFEDKKGVLSLDCMAHVRRKFEAAFQTTPEAVKALDYTLLYFTNLEADDADYEQICRERHEKAFQSFSRWKNG